MLGGLFKLGEAYRTQCSKFLHDLRSDCQWFYDARYDIGAMAAAKVLMLENIDQLEIAASISSVYYDLIKMAGAAGFEPTTLGFGDRCSTTELYPFT